MFLSWARVRLAGASVPPLAASREAQVTASPANGTKQMPPVAHGRVAGRGPARGAGVVDAEIIGVGRVGGVRFQRGNARRGAVRARDGLAARLGHDRPPALPCRVGGVPAVQQRRGLRVRLVVVMGELVEQVPDGVRADAHHVARPRGDPVRAGRPARGPRRPRPRYSARAPPAASSLLIRRILHRPLAVQGAPEQRRALPAARPGQVLPADNAKLDAGEPFCAIARSPHAVYRRTLAYAADWDTG